MLIRVHTGRDAQAGSNRLKSLTFSVWDFMNQPINAF